MKVMAHAKTPFPVDIMHPKILAANGATWIESEDTYVIVHFPSISHAAAWIDGVDPSAYVIDIDPYRHGESDAIVRIVEA